MTPRPLAMAIARSIAAAVPDRTTCPPPLSLATSQDLALGGLGRDGGGRLGLDADQRRHGALPRRHGRLHGVAADAQQASGFGDREGTGGGQGGIFSERMASQEGGAGSELESRLGLEHAQGGEARRHQGRLGVRREGQFGLGTLEHQPGQGLSQRVVDLGEDARGGGVGVPEGAPHPDGLGALSWEDEGRRHVHPRGERAREHDRRSGVNSTLCRRSPRSARRAEKPLSP